MAVKNKKVIAGVGAAVVALVAIGAGTVASFSDTRSGPGGTADAGTLFFGEESQLRLAAIGPVAPGEPVGSRTLVLQNGGDLPGVLDVDLSTINIEDGCAGELEGPERAAEQAVSNGGSCESPGFDSGQLGGKIQYKYTEVDVDGETVDGGVSTSGFVALDTLNSNAREIDHNLDPGEFLRLRFDFDFPDTPGTDDNRAQGDSVLIQVVATIDQQ